MRITTAILNKDTSFCIYAHVNKINGKRYIGYTNNVNDRWEGKGRKYKTCPRFWSAISHYGWDGFEHVILEDELSYKEALKKESYYINKYDTLNPDKGYNLTEGGTGGNTHVGWTEERKEQYRQTCLKELDRRLQDNKWKENLSKAQKERWRKVKTGEYPQPKSRKGKDVPNVKSVRCVETGQEFDCCADAAEWLGYPRAKSLYVSRVANGKRHTFAGYHWEYI